MNKKLPELTIFFPFWNEAENIEEVVTKAAEAAPDVADQWEILMIDDGSTDDTAKIGKRLAKKDSRVKLISHFPNRGYGSALREGFTNAQYKYIVFNDGDGQFDFNQIQEFIPHIRTHDLVIGYRKKRNDQSLFIRVMFMNLLKIWDYIFFRFYFRDIDCGFKMFKKSAVEKLGTLKSDGAMITTEILAKATKRNLKIKEVGVEHYPRKHGEQSGSNPAVILRAVLETFIIWWDIKFNRF